MEIKIEEEKDSKKPTIYKVEETFNKINNEKCSMARFGDGEIFIMFGQRGVGFQSFHEKLAKRLKEIIQSEDQNILICLHDAYSNFFENRTKDEREYWREHLKEYSFPLSKLINESRIYGNSCVTRFYSISEDKTRCEFLFRLFQKIWANREAVIVEGEKTRIGVGNDLLKNCKSVRRILCPPENAFDQYEKIYNEVTKQDKDKLILIALGPTATVLAYDLHKKGYQALDIGHIDIEYEWFLRKVQSRIPIEGKYVNEASYKEPEEIKNKEYDDQIICKIK